MKSAEEVEKRKLLYTHWDDLPFEIHIDSANFFRMDQSRVKSFIVKYIRNGIQDEFSKEHQLGRRHAFTVKELHAAYEKETNQQYSHSNFHYHIKKLIADGFIQEIARILKERHYHSYYGRTTKNFEPLYDENMDSFIRDNVLNPLKIIMSKMNKDVEDHYINSLINENVKHLQNYYLKVREWTKTNYPLLYESKMDIRALSNYIGHFALVNTDLAENLLEIAELTGLAKIVKNDTTNIKDEEL